MLILFNHKQIYIYYTKIIHIVSPKTKIQFKDY